ncbi:DUF2157 domain-containing protein [Sphaerisporangium sp. NPDC049002]|uniref:DUF2157 domain-containing protein n=1 Tax=Sphaerisporangium sp. NPDC049002 TaxID=3155392 RepID=UPI0033F59E0D
MESIRQVPARRLAWLHGELARWQAEGIIDADTARRIGGRYAVGRRLSLERLVLVLGGGFLGVGLIWLVSANLDQLPPLARLAGIVLVWIGSAVIGEVLSHPAGKQAARLVTVLAGGGVIFQTAQSLQVPAYTSVLLGVWAAGTLAYAYATGAAGPLVAALVIGATWYGWLVGEQADGAAAVSMSLLFAGAVALSAAVLHERARPPAPAPSAVHPVSAPSAGHLESAPPGRPSGSASSGVRIRFAAPWRLAGVVLALCGLFVAAFPGVGRDELFGSAALWAGLALAAVAVGAALVLGDANGRREVLAVGIMTGLALLLVVWSPGGDYGYSGGFTAGQTARAVVGTLVYILAASWFAVAAARRDLSYLVFLATAALVVFVTAQSFAVFQPLFTGAALFLVLGVVLILTGTLAFYGRRRLMEATR